MVIRTCTNCGKDFSIRESDVKRGRGIFCGKSCAASGVNGNTYRHGHTMTSTGQTKEYRAWSGIKKRTTLPNQSNSKYYYDRGIEMCDRWINSFETFLEDMGMAPSKNHSVDRINVDGNYEPSNCRWATVSEQMSNMRSNKFIEFKGRRMTQEEWGREIGLSGTIICKRLKRGWSVEKTITTPRVRTGHKTT